MTNRIAEYTAAVNQLDVMHTYIMATGGKHTRQHILDVGIVRHCVVPKYSAARVDALLTILSQFSQAVFTTIKHHEDAVVAFQNILPYVLILIT